MLVGITVSTRYDDILNIVLPQNYKFFDTWYIVTHKDDSKTIDVINQHGFKNVVTLFYEFYRPGASFDRGGAVRMVQEMLAEQRYEGNVLLLDSDIYLPDTFTSILEAIPIVGGVMYGAVKKDEYYTLEHFKNGIIDNEYEKDYDIGKPSFHGYFQLYRFNPAYLYVSTHNCSMHDTIFHGNFERLEGIPGMFVAHLGRSAINWDGRNGYSGFEL